MSKNENTLILNAQREYSDLLASSYKPYNSQQIRNLILANNEEDGAGILTNKFQTSYGRLHYLFLFAEFSNKDKVVYQNYSDVYAEFYSEVSLVRNSVINKRIVGIIEKDISQYLPKYLLLGKTLSGTYTWENGSSDLALELRVKYANAITEDEHINLMKEHFNQMKLKIK